LRKKYDLKALAQQHGFSTKEIEKVCRISDLLERISAVKFLSDRLSLYGGTAFTFIYAPEILRLSVDLDFNYRHKDGTDWREVRDKIDEKLKDLLYGLEYAKADIKINASYPLTRFVVSYVNTLGLEDKFKIETGYLRRTPILKTDILADFKHLGTQETFKTRTPSKEELFANKWCTLLYRKSSRDLFDTNQIANTEFNIEAFRKSAIIDSLTHKKPKIYEINPSAIEQIPIDLGLKNLLQTERLAEHNFSKMKLNVGEFTKTHLSSITSSEIQAIDQFYDQRIFDPNMIDSTGFFLHESVGEYPAALWILQRIKKEGTGRVTQQAIS
jgi:predicted nucleotidyltransferase component of viral defense system